MSLLRPRVRDDRRQVVDLVAPPSRARDERQLRRIEGKLARYTLEARVASLKALLLTLPLLIAWFAVVWKFPPSRLSQVISSAMAVLWLTAQYALIRRFRAQAITRHYSIHRLCASCGYDLSELPLATDGCTVCPECGAAWRLPEQPSPPPSS